MGSIATERVSGRTIAICIAGEVLKESLIILCDSIIAVVIMIRSLTYDGILDPARISRDVDDKVRCCDAAPRKGRHCRILQIRAEALNFSSVIRNQHFGG